MNKKDQLQSKRGEDVAGLEISHVNFYRSPLVLNSTLQLPVITLPPSVCTKKFSLGFLQVRLRKENNIGSNIKINNERIKKTLLVLSCLCIS